MNFRKEMQENPTAAVLVVRFDDLGKIGHTMFKRDGKLHILANPETAGIDGTTDIEFVTDMPYEKTN